MELGNVFVLAEPTKLRLEVAKPALHVAVLPRAAPVAGTELDFVAFTHKLVCKAQVLGSLVAMQDGGSSELSQCVLQCRKRQLTGMPGAKSPTNRLPGFEIEYHCQVVPALLKPQIREVLCPSMGIDHVGVIHAGLRVQLIPKPGIPLENVWRRSNLWLASSVPAFLGCDRYDNASQRPNTLGFLAVPAQVNGEPPGAVERMLVVSGLQCSDVLPVGGRQAVCVVVKAALADTKPSTKLPAPSWVDFLQDG